jgi:hypothetical protein
MSSAAASATNAINNRNRTLFSEANSLPIPWKYRSCFVPALKSGDSIRYRMFDDTVFSEQGFFLSIFTFSYKILNMAAI